MTLTNAEQERIRGILSEACYVGLDHSGRLVAHFKKEDIESGWVQFDPLVEDGYIVSEMDYDKNQDKIKLTFKEGEQ